VIQTIVIFNIKGGTAKSTTALNVGAALAEMGHRVLLVDLDPQSTLTQNAGLNPYDLKYSLYDTFRDFITTYEAHLERTIYPVRERLDLAATNPLLNGMLDELASVPRREYILEQLLEPLCSCYDYVIIDTLPYYGTLTINALTAADSVLIPMTPDVNALLSTQLTLAKIDAIKRARLNTRLKPLGLLLTKVDTRTALTRQVIERAHGLFDHNVHIFNTQIKATIRVAEAQGAQVSVLEYAPAAEVADGYRSLAREIVAEVQGVTV